jgi:hypothetical protein
MRLRPPFRLSIGARRPIADANFAREYLISESDKETRFAVGAARVTLFKAGAAVTVSVPFADVDHLYYRRQEGCLVISNDPRSLCEGDANIDSRGVYSLLQFGAAVPPLTLWKEIGRFLPGQSVRISVSNLNITRRTGPLPWDRYPEADGTDDDAQIRLVEKTLDEVLGDLCPAEDPVVLFSGGIDSGLIAARAAALGWRDTTLFHYSFAEEDPETQLAKAMAKHLGLKLRCVYDDPSSIEVLDRIGTTYRHPFYDHSTLPTFRLAQAAVSEFGSDRVLLDGTGADGAFGLFGKADRLARLYKSPLSLRRVGARLYVALEAWHRRSFVETPLRLARRSVQLPLPLGGIAQNALEGIAYTAPNEVVEETVGLLESWMSCVLPLKTPRVLLSGLDLAVVCSGVFAQKAKAIFDGAGIRVGYPFLDDRVVSLALCGASQWRGAEVPKRPLSLALRGHVPPAMIDRPKSGFAARDIGERMRQEVFLSALDGAVERSELGTIQVERRALQAIRHDLCEGVPLPTQTYNLVWALVFQQLWSQQSSSLHRESDG